MASQHGWNMLKLLIYSQHLPGQRGHFWCGWHVVGSQMGWPEDGLRLRDASVLQFRERNLGSTLNKYQAFKLDSPNLRFCMFFCYIGFHLETKFQAGSGWIRCQFFTHLGQRLGQKNGKTMGDALRGSVKDFFRCMFPPPPQGLQIWHQIWPRGFAFFFCSDFSIGFSDFPFRVSSCDVLFFFGYYVH